MDRSLFGSIWLDFGHQYYRYVFCIQIEPCYSYHTYQVWLDFPCC
ncbi:Uncharacterised protein [Vibrio cholerae]|nr:Uncharacterised protein [Vibrio cholerae]